MPPTPTGLTPASSAESSSSTTPKRSSPLNPTSTPTKAPLPLAELDDDLQGFPDAPGRVRGAAMSSPRNRSSPLPKPTVTVSSSPASTVSPLPPDGAAPHEGRLSSLIQRARSKSPSRYIHDNVWRKKVNEGPAAAAAAGASPSASWWGEPSGTAQSWEEPPRRQRKLSPEEKEAWEHTRQRVAFAVKSALGTTADVVHELLEIGTDFLQLAPVPGLSSAAKTLLNIWDALEHVDLNTLSCLRLTERCAETLIAVLQEVHGAGGSVTLELQGPVFKLQESFDNVRRLLVKEATRPFIKRYLKRDEILSDIEGCDADLRAALDMFNLSVSIRILKQTQESEKRRQIETQAILAAMLAQQQQQSIGNALMLTGVAQTTSPPQSPQHNTFKEAIIPSIPAVVPSIPPSQISQMSAEQLQSALSSLQTAQNALDFFQDTENLRQLMRLALQTTSDTEMLELLQIKRPEMPEAIKTLQRALERVIEQDREPEPPMVPNKPVPLLRRFSTRKETSTSGLRRGPTVDSVSSSSGSIGSSTKGDALDKEFLESGIDALRRMSRGVETNLPSWTITKFEVDRDQKIGIGFFSDVYKGTWRGRTVAIKVLADITPRELFRREVAIWKTLRHPNVLELYGASSTAGDPPWFFVSPYEKNGSLVDFLRRVYGQGRSSGSSSLGSSSVGRSPGHSSASLPPGAGAGAGAAGSSKKTDRTVTYPIWPGVNSNQFAAPPKARSPLRDTEYRKSRDLHRFMYEIAKGMEYLHSQNVHHGDLKAANVLVNDNLHCVISDFGQSEMKSEAFSLSGVSSPHGTLRWQAPELLRGPSHLTQEMDAYAYAICCVEVLSWGNLPWPYADDVAIRHLVLDQNARPSLPTSKYVTPALQDLVRSCWDKDPARRPPFSQIVSRMKAIRKSAGDILDDVGSPRLIEMPELDEDYHPRPSPDMRPSPLTDVLAFPQLDYGPNIPLSDRVPHEENSVPTADIKFPEPLIFTPTTSRQSSMLASSSSEESADHETIHLHPYTGYNSPPPADDIIAQIKNERRYRLMLTHEYNPSLTLPLWEPSVIDLGAVGYLSKPSGTFITLFNAFQPNKSSLEAVRAIPPIAKYGRVTTGSQRTQKRNNWMDTIMGLLTSKNKGNSVFPHAVNHRYTVPLKTGHKAAFLCAETPEYRYMISDDGGKLDVPKQWFKVNVDTIMKIYGAQHQIQREELFLVVGTLRASNYALFVSHNHPEGHAHFNAFASPKAGQPWGMFTTDSEYDGAGPCAESPDESSRQSASKVSSHGGPWDTVLAARLRFKPDNTEPTTL